jgi:hypothetical protein
VKAWVAPRKRGGLDYRDVLVRRGALYVGKVRFDGTDYDHLDRGGVAYLPREVMEAIGLKPALMRHAKLHHCACAGC